MKRCISLRSIIAATSMLCLAAASAAAGDDILAPGDDIRGIEVDGDAVNVGGVGVIAGANNWPSPEGPEHAIDGVGQKYLNFGETNTGFLATPSAGHSIATGITLWTANDSEARDPAGYQVWGTNSALDDLGPFSLSDFTLISEGDLALPSTRNNGGNAPLLPENSQTVAFANTEYYRSYLVVFPDVKDSAMANSMQIAEAQLDGMICDDGVDADGDGVGDLCDLCDGDDAAGDSDSDGVCDDVDGCPTDPDKDDPGVCGCGAAETDTDGDGVADCNDQCPNADDALDADGNGTPDCLEPPPAPQEQPAGCCAPGVFPTVGFLMPLALLGWKTRQNSNGRQRCTGLRQT